MSDPIELRRVAKGKRPQYFDDLVTDNLFTMVLALTEELSVAIDRIDSLEQMLESKGVVTVDSLANFEPSEAASARRAKERDLMMKRLFRATESQYRNRTAGKETDIEEATR